MQTRRALLLAASLFAVAGCEGITTTDPSSETQDGTPEDAQTGTETSVTRRDPAAKIRVSDGLKSQLLASREVELIVEFDDSSVRTKSVDVRDAVQRNREIRQALLRDLRSLNLKVTREYTHLPMMVVRASSMHALNALAAHDGVVNVFENIKLRPATTQSLGAVASGGIGAAANATDGNTSYVAIIDTGLNYDNNVFGDCNSTLVSAGDGNITTRAGGASCAVIGMTQTTIGDDNQTDSDGNTSATAGHGTLVAAIVHAVAPAAKLWGYDVFPKDSNTTSADEAQNLTTSGTDVTAAIDEILSLKSSGQVPFNVINLSLEAVNNGGLSVTCNNDGGLFGSAIRRATSAGIVVVTAAGNGGRHGELLTPACDTRSISVGATWDATSGSSAQYLGCTDTPTAGEATCFTNMSQGMTLMAPGGIIDAANVTGKVGTSLSAAHATGAVAVLRSLFPSETVTDIKNRLVQSSSATVTRTKTATAGTQSGQSLTITKPRLDLASARSSSLCVVRSVSATDVNLTAVAGNSSTITLTGNSSCTDGSSVASGIIDENVSWVDVTAGTWSSGTSIVTFAANGAYTTKGGRSTTAVTVAGETITVRQSGDTVPPNVSAVSIALVSPSTSTYTTGPNAGQQYVTDTDWNISMTGAVTDAVSSTLRYCLKAGQGTGADDNASCTPSTNYTANGSTTTYASQTANGQGLRYVTLWIGDEAGNNVKAGTTIYRYVDTTKPQIDSITATDTTSVALSWTASDCGGAQASQCSGFSSNIVQYDVYRKAQKDFPTEPTCADVNSTYNIKTLVNVLSTGDVNVTGTPGAGLDGSRLTVSDVDGTTTIFELDSNSSTGAGATPVSYYAADTNDTWTLAVTSTSPHAQAFDFNGTTYRLCDRMTAGCTGGGTVIDYYARDVNSTVDLDFASLDADANETIFLDDGTVSAAFDFVDTTANGGFGVDINVTGLSAAQIASAFESAVTADGNYTAVLVTTTLVRVESPRIGSGSNWSLSSSGADLGTINAIANADGNATAAKTATTTTTAIAGNIASFVDPLTSATVSNGGTSTVTFTSATPGASGVLSISESAAGLTLTNTVPGVTQDSASSIATKMRTAINGAAGLATTATGSGIVISLAADVYGATTSLSSSGTAFTLGSPKMDNGNAVALTYTDSNVTATTDGTGYWYTVCATDTSGKVSTGDSVLGRPRTDTSAPTFDVNGSIDVLSVSGLAAVTPTTGSSGVSQLAALGYCDDSTIDTCDSNSTSVTVRLSGISAADRNTTGYACFSNSDTGCTSSSGISTTAGVIEKWFSTAIDANGTTAPVTVSISGSGDKTYYVFVADAAFNVSAPKSVKFNYDTATTALRSLTLLPLADNDVNLTYTPAADGSSGNWQYRVVRSPAPSATATTGTTAGCQSDTNISVVTAPANPVSVQFIDSDANLSAGTKYFYRVCVRDRAGNWNAGTESSVMVRPEIDGPTPQVAASRTIIVPAPSAACSTYTVLSGTVGSGVGKSACENDNCYWDKTTGNYGTCRENLVRLGSTVWTRKTNPRVFIEAIDASNKSTTGAPQTYRNEGTGTTVTHGTSGMSVCFNAGSLLASNCRNYISYDSIDANTTAALLSGDGSRYMAVWVKDVWGNVSDSNPTAAGPQPFRDQINVDRTPPTATGTLTAVLASGTVTLTGTAQTNSGTFYAPGAIEYKVYFAKGAAPNGSVCKYGTAAVTACSETDVNTTSMSCTWTPNPAPAAGTKYGFRICAKDGQDNWNAGVATTSLVTF